MLDLITVDVYGLKFLNQLGKITPPEPRTILFKCNVNNVSMIDFAR